MASSTPKSMFLRGIRDGSPFLLIAGPFAMLFGVVATEAGFNLIETMAFSIVVIAGAAQFTAVSLMTENAPTLIVLATALAVNLRMAMYSASLTPYLGAAPLWKRAVMSYFLVDQSYGVSIVAYEENRDWNVQQRVAYFFGVIIPVCPMWYVFTLIGALVGSAVPEWMALDFALPITFLAMTAPTLKSAAHVTVATVSVILTLFLAFIPFNLGLLIAAGIAMIAGAWVEQRMVRAAA